MKLTTLIALLCLTILAIPASAQKEDIPKNIADSVGGPLGWTERQFLSVAEAMPEAKHAGHPDLPYWLITLQYGKQHSRAQPAWSVATLRTLDRLTNGSQARNHKARRGKNP